MKRRKFQSYLTILTKRHPKIFRMISVIFWMSFLLVAWEIYAPMLSYVFDWSLFMARLWSVFTVILINFVYEYSK